MPNSIIHCTKKWNLIERVLKSKILICYDFFPPAFKGGGIIRSVFNLSEFLTEFCEVYVFTSDSDLGASSKLNVSPNTWVDYAPDLKVFYSDKTQQSLMGVYQIMNHVKPDVIYLNGVFTPRFSLIPLLIFKFLNVPPLLVIAPRGMLAEGALSIKPLKKKLYLFVFKQLGFHRKMKWQATSQQEILDISRVFGSNCSIEMASNIPEINTSAFFDLEKHEKSLTIVFLALISPVKNLKYLIDLVNQIPEPYSISLDIYGPVKDSYYWEECINAIKLSPRHIQISYKGELEPSEVNKVLGRYHLFSLLTLGENFGHSIFESLNAGTPVVISNKTPWKDLDKYEAGWDMDLNEGARIVRLFLEIADMDQNAYPKFRIGARNHANRFIEETDFKKQYGNLFEISCKSNNQITK